MEGKKLLLHGLRLPEKTIQEEHNLSNAALVEGRGIWLQFMEISDNLGGASVEPATQAILNEFKIVFVEPEGLLPPKSHDHQIQLQEAAKPTCVRLYRYPYYQKNKLRS